MDALELITVEEFAKRMKISRTTVFDWIRKGRLKAGRHYIKVGRVIRFEWGPELLQRLREDSLKEQEEHILPRRPRLRERRSSNSRAAINLRY